MTAEKIAKLFHDTYETLAPTFGYATRSEPRKDWAELPDNHRRLMTATASVVERVLQESSSPPQAESNEAQRLEWERNAWQRRCGVLLAFVEEASRHGGFDQNLLDALYAVVNQNPFTKSIDDPHADIAKLTVQFTLDSAAAAGLITPPVVMAQLNRLIENLQDRLDDEGEDTVDVDMLLEDLRVIAGHAPTPTIRSEGSEGADSTG